MQAVTEMAMKDMVTEYNSLASLLGTAFVKKFSDKPTAQKRLKVMRDKAKATKPKAERKKREMRFVFPFHGQDQLRKIQSMDSLRGTVYAALSPTGATFAEVVKLVEAFDKRRGHGPGHVERRAYEVVRLLHYYVGYGLKQDDEGRIFTHTNG
jgi:hypothetical protein